MSDDTVRLLENKLNEARTVMRAYDTRAQIVGVGYILALGMLIAFESRFPKSEVVIWLDVLVVWVIIMAPVFLFGFVIYPLRKYRPFLYSRTYDDEPNFFCAPKDVASVNSIILEQAKSSNIEHELAAELRHMEMLKRTKMIRFIRAMKGAALSFLILFLFQLWRSLALFQIWPSPA